MTEDQKKFEYGIYNTDPRQRDRRRWEVFWNRDLATKSINSDLVAKGWLPMFEAPKNRYVGLYFRGNTSGDFEGSAAFVLEEDRWHVAESKMIFDASQAIAWKRWTKETLTAEPLPPKGRRG